MPRLTAIFFNRRPDKSPLEKEMVECVFSKDQLLGVVTVSQTNVWSSLDHLGAVFFSQKTKKMCYKVLGAKT